MTEANYVLVPAVEWSTYRPTVLMVTGSIPTVTTNIFKKIKVYFVLVIHFIDANSNSAA